ncbi:uncharacterized protein FA14DRAFT_27101 [Meira miltonrushii]|uniref:Arabinanase/levansucrase/invertase n=1 Tax=Meira miltonrushii TaxID=1280837 RepID=A0A316VQL5_9BASI|nr:uncharacterized protein FA14DRAFT_27101 [Meira miltonrushii]PWN38451.1 hypothetical protein FA14DRAFT_27101 [Meira miltonrushii]
MTSFKLFSAVLTIASYLASSSAFPTTLQPRSDYGLGQCILNTIPVSSLPKAIESVSQNVFASSNGGNGGGKPYAGYFFIFFKDDTEQVNAGLSIGNNALNYTLYNGGEKPILTSNVGSKHTRDPYLVRAPDHSKNWIIATDNSLRAKDIDAVRNASRKITIYESQGASLTKWNPARLSPDLAGSWSGGVSAPEAYWLEDKKTFMVIFGSNSFNASDVDHKGEPGKSEIYYTLTTDFQTFTEAKPYYVIPDGGLTDMTIASLGKQGSYVRFFRDDTNGALKVRGQITSDGVFGTWKDIGNSTSYVSDNNDANGGPLIFKDNLDHDLWHIWIDYFTGGYKPFETEDITKSSYKVSDAPSFPKDLKQGAVIPVTCAEYNELIHAW